MIRITALNDRNKYAHGGIGGQKSCVQISRTKEALESEAISLYNKGLSFRKQGQARQAIQTLIDVLNLPFLQEATFSSPEDGISHSAELLKYSAYKNLAEMSEMEENRIVAMEYYIEAVAVDSTDVTVWFKMGRLAMSLENFSLARHAFEMGLQCNSNHWPCLDNIISLMYALNNYEACLHYVARALGLDPSYAKAIVFMRKIFSEHPGLRSWSMDIFLKCDQSIYNADVDEEESEEYVKEAVDIRLRKQELCKSPELPSVTFTQPLTSLTWKSLGQRLFDLYEHVSQRIKEQTDISQPGISLASLVDLTVNVLPLKSADVISAPSPPPVAVQSQTPCIDFAPPNTTTCEPIPTTPTRDPLLSLSEMGSGIELEDVTFSGGRKRGRKRKSMFAEEPECKRRSARVKNPVKSSVEGPISYQEVLYKLLPKALLTNADDCQMTSDLQRLEVTSGGDDKSKEDPCDKACMSRRMANEEEDVEKFINDHKANNGVIDLITKFLIHLADSSDLIWPDGLTEMFLKLYQKLRKHIVYPNYFSNDASDEWIQKMAKMSLMHKELKLDRWFTNNINIVQPSPRKSPVAGLMGPNFPGKNFEMDVDYLVGLSCLSDRLGDFWLEFSIRVSWLQARYSLLQNNMEMATDCFEKTAEYVQMLNQSGSTSSISLANCAAGRIISLCELEQQLDALRRCQSMEELRRLADSGQHSKVIDFLLPVSAAAKDLDIERMQLLQESIVACKEYRRGLLWTEEYFHETLRRYKTTTSTSQKGICKAIVIQLLFALNQFLDGDPSVMTSLSGQWMFRLSHNLLDVINISLDVPEGTVAMALETVTPWIILYKLIKHCEDSEAAANDEEALSSSLSLIIYAHEYLGRHSWCMTCEGDLLLFMVQALTEELNKYGTDDPHPFEEDLDNAVQQCFYCLYSHRSKKAKYLDDHNVAQIPLTLERCQWVFDFFKPKTLPEYDSYKMNAISAELEALLKRIFPLIPQMNNTGIEADITAYIEGATNTPPSAHADREVKYPLVKELYYLLADYYFKNKEQLKAIKFYMFDICINPTRFDSWAGMALARSSRLENKLTSVLKDILNVEDDDPQEASLQKQAFSTLRCFKRAMELDDSNVKLWIEYGSCAYQLHSHASRLLKQTKFSPLSKEIADQATINKTEMLMIALNCYNQAEACAQESGNKEEKWLLHYMLGKIAEKLDQDPSIYLEHYKKASYCLHEDKAKYPKKISYFSPPHLSVEALEMYYRTHVCIVKYLMKREKEFEKIPFDVFESYIKDASNSPLSNCAEKEKKHDRKSELVDGKETPGGRAGTQATCNDHNYSKQKVTTQSTASATDSSKDTVASTAALPQLSTSVPAPLSYPSSSDDMTGGGVGGNSDASLQNLPAEAGLCVFDGVTQLSVSKVDEQPLDLTHHSVDAGPVGMEVPAALSPAKGQPEMVDLNNCLQRETDMEVAVNQPEVDNSVGSQQELGSQQDATVSMASVSPRAEQKSDSDALDDLISTLAAVQKSLEKEEDRVETVLLKTEKQDNESEIAAESKVVKMETGLSESFPGHVAEGTDTAENQSKDVPMEVEIPQGAVGVKPEKLEEPMDIEGTPDGTKGAFQKEADTAKNQLQDEVVGSQLTLFRGPELDQAKAVEDSAALHLQLRKRFLFLMGDCMKALYLCQTRFPEHFKSLYRLAYICFYSVHYKDVGRCKELLLGGGSAHIGLFIERKQNNFFNGLWRNPVQDFDRWGSFSAHLDRALLLLFEVLTVTRDSRLLFSLHQHLCRAPVDIGKKYLRDTDRIQLARMAFTLCCKAVEAQVHGYESAKGTSSLNKPDKRFLVHVCLVRQESHKLNLNVKELDDLLVKTYRLCDGSEVAGPLTEDAIQHHFAVMPTPKVPQCASVEREGRPGPADLHVPMTSALAVNFASNRGGIRLPAPPTATRPLQVEKASLMLYRPAQRPLCQPDKIQKPFTSAKSADDIEIIDLSADDCVQVINVSSSAEEEMLTSEAVPPNATLCEESKAHNEIKKEDNAQAGSGNEKDFPHSDALLPKEISQEVAPVVLRKDSLKEATTIHSIQDPSKSLMAPTDIPASAKDLSKAAVQPKGVFQKEFSRFAASAKELSKGAEFPKQLSRTQASSQELGRTVVYPKELAKAAESQRAISTPIPSQKSILTSVSSTILSRDVPNPAFPKTMAFTRGPRPTKESLQFFKHATLENIRPEPYRKALMPPSLLSNVELLSTLPQETRNLLISPQKISQQPSMAGNQASNVASKWTLSPRSSHTNQQAAVRVRPVSPSPSELSSSSLSDDNEDGKDEVIELSSSIDSD